MDMTISLKPHIKTIFIVSVILVGTFLVFGYAGASSSNIVVSCYATPNQVNANQSVTFIASASGGTGNYQYSWSGNCSINSSQSCTRTFNQQGVYTTTVSVISGGQIATANCSVNVNSGQFCSGNSYQQCVGNMLYWYDSCGNQQQSQYCQYGCSNNQCLQYQNQYPNQYQYQFNNCVPQAYRLCVGNNIYWYDSCGNQQDLYQSCYGANQTCKYGACVYKAPAPVPVPTPKPTPVPTPAPTPTPTPENKCGNKTCESNLGETAETCPEDCKAETAEGLVVSFFAKPDAETTQWQESVQVGQNDQAHFMISIANNGTQEIKDIKVSVEIPTEIALLGNVQINGALTDGNIVSGINIGSLGIGTAKIVTFEGKTQSFSNQETKQAIAKASVLESSKTASLDVSLAPGQVAGASISSTGTSKFVDFLKRWYLWIFIGLLMIFLFFVVFKRLSTDNA